MDYINQIVEITLAHLRQKINSIQNVKYEHYRINIRRRNNFFRIKQVSISSNSMRPINYLIKDELGYEWGKSIQPQKTIRIELD